MYEALGIGEITLVYLGMRQQYQPELYHEMHYFPFCIQVVFKCTLIVIYTFIRNYNKASETYKAKQNCIYHLNTGKGSGGGLGKHCEF